MARVRIPLSCTKASQMPSACMICGGAVDAHVAKLFSWRPSFLSVGFYLSLFFCQPLAIVMVIVGFVNTRRVLVECPVCERHRGYWVWRGFWTFAPLMVITVADLSLGIFITLGVRVASRLLPDGAFAFLFFGTAAGLLLWAGFVAILRNFSVRVEEIGPDDITLNGVSRAFADLLRYDQGQKKEAPDFGWEDYDPYPRRPVLP